MPAKPDRGASVRGRAQLGHPPRLPGSVGDQQPIQNWTNVISMIVSLKVCIIYVEIKCKDMIEF